MAAHPVTLSDVAARARVSTTTASYVLNGRAGEMRISAETQRRVREAVSALHYRPNRNARNLRTASTKLIGVVVDSLAPGSVGEMLSGASMAARLASHLLVVAETKGDAEVEASVIEELLDRQVDGIVYAREVTVEVAVPPALTERRAVLLNCVDRSRSLPAVLHDEVHGGQVAARALADAGIAEMVFAVGENPAWTSIAGRLRLQGLRSGLQAAGHELAGVVDCGRSVSSAYDGVRRWLRGGARPSALVCLEDRAAMGVYQALSSCGLDVPREVSVVSSEGSELTRWLRPALSSVAPPYDELGALAVRTLTERTSRHPALLRLRPTFVARDSVRGKPPGGHEAGAHLG